MQSQTLNIALPRELVKKVDEQARKEYKNRSELIRELLQQYIQRREDWEEIFKFGQKAMRRMGIKSEKDVDKIVYKFRHGKKSH